MKEENTLKGQKRLRFRRLWMKGLAAAAVLVLIVLGGLLVLRYVSYEHINIVETFEKKSIANAYYEEYAEGIIEYGKDGIAYLKKDGSEVWNQPCQMASPFAALCQEAAAIADKGGTNILVFQKEGLKGEIKTTRPIEKITISAQGIVAAILKDENIPQIICYDAKGNILVELKSTFSNNGYPVDIALSQDGNVLIVSYLQVKGAAVESQVVYYHFGKAGENATEHKVEQMSFSDSLVPVVVFLNKNISLLVSDHSFILMKGLDDPEKMYELSFDTQICRVAYSDEMIAFILKKAEGYELCTYDLEGKMIFSQEIQEEYVDMKISDGQVFLMNESKCAIFNSIGICKYEGNTEMQILDIFPVRGLEKYNVISTTGFQKIQLVK